MSHSTNNYFSILIATFFCCVFAACKNHQHPDKKIFYYNEQSGIASLDPAFAKNQSIMWAVHQLYNTLVEVDENMQLKPSLAKSWVIQEDRKTILFTLRNDVFFTNDIAFANGKGKQLTEL
jgi:peptide/nickel transport system substrate-binding protein